jgi:hypothetical protein
MPANTYGGYPAAGRDYGYYANPVKRQRTSIDFGNRGMYDADGRMRQVEAYPQTAPMYANQPGAYPTPTLLQGYPTGHTGVADYAVRQTSPMPTPTSPQSEFQDCMRDDVGPGSSSDSIFV